MRHLTFIVFAFAVSTSCLAQPEKPAAWSWAAVLFSGGIGVKFGQVEDKVRLSFFTGMNLIGGRGLSISPVARWLNYRLYSYGVGLRLDFS